MAFPADPHYLRLLSLPDRMAYQRVLCDSGDRLEDRLRVIPQHLLPTLPELYYVPSLKVIFKLGSSMGNRFSLPALIVATENLYLIGLTFAEIRCLRYAFELKEKDPQVLCYFLKALRVLKPKFQRSCDELLNN